MPGCVKTTAKQNKFALLIAQGENASEAYRRVYDCRKMGAMSIKREAHIVSKNPKVIARVAELTIPAAKEAGLTVERVMREIERIAFSDTRKLFREDGTLKEPDEWDDETAAAIAGLEVQEEFSGQGAKRKLTGRSKRVKVWDKNSALEKAMRHLGMFERDNKQKAENIAIQVVLV